MLKTIAAIALGGFVLKRTAPDTYHKVVQAADDLVNVTSDIMTAARGQCAAYTAEAAADAASRLQAVDPAAVAKLRAMLDGTAPSQQPAAPRRVAPRHRP